MVPCEANCATLWYPSAGLKNLRSLVGDFVFDHTLFQQFDHWLFDLQKILFFSQGKVPHIGSAEFSPIYGKTMLARSSGFSCPSDPVAALASTALAVRVGLLATWHVMGRFG